MEDGESRIRLPVCADLGYSQGHRPAICPQSRLQQGKSFELIGGSLCNVNTGIGPVIPSSGLIHRIVANIEYYRTCLFKDTGSFMITITCKQVIPFLT